tara:strand:- start:2539 stop:4287 length:1749 start_codon:yes stop_codon:yes gene_type:complete
MLNQRRMDKNQSPKNILKRVYFHLDIVRKKQLFALFFLSIFSSLTESISIAILIPFINIFIHQDTFMTNDTLKFFFNIFNIDDENLLGAISILFVLIIILSAVIKISFIYFSNRCTSNVTSDFRIKVFDFFINQNFSYFTSNGSNKIMISILKKSKYTSQLIMSSLNILNSIFISFAILSILIYYDPYSTIIIILSTGIFFYIIFKIQAIKAFKIGEELNIKLRFLVDIFTNAAGYLPEIIIYNLKNFYSKIYRNYSKRNAQLDSDLASIPQYAKPYFEAFVIIFVVALIYFGNLSEKSLLSNISYFAILAFAGQKCLPLINGIYKSSIIFKGAIPIVSDTLNILDNAKYNTRKSYNKNEYIKPLPFKNKINIDKLKFQYTKDLPFILNNISFEINKGDKVLIKGKTGKGKSTLINIILGLLNPTEGKLVIDDVEINENNQSAWQRNIAIVPQSIFINDVSILENIALTENFNDINLDKILKCTKIAQIDSYIETLPNKYYENLGERGVKLSGGQRQRLAIARALYREANLIVLDEPTNALDNETEKKVIDSLIRSDTTIIMISHSEDFNDGFNKIIDLNSF